ncbi:MAG: DUF6261 family protein [Odoribacteraceae bacterium]|jgi:predicted transcriptional regulator|nr:DUF6261 family protein [Odoribacteraceae bacterium]
MTTTLLVILSFHLLRHETIVQFTKDIIALIDKIGAGAVGIKAIADKLKISYATMAAALDNITKSGFTEKIKEQDSIRDGIYRGLAATIHAATLHFDPATREAADSLKVVIDNYAHLLRKSYNDESAAIDDMLREFTSTTYAPSITALGLDGYVTQLSAANARFFELIHQRYDEEAARVAVPMKKARAVVEEDLHAMVARVEAAATLLGLDSNPDLAAFATEYNIIASKYKQTLAQEKGRRKSSSSNKEDEGNDESDQQQ